MPITTIDQNNPYLQRYGGLTVSADLADQLATMQMNGAMVGQDPFNGVQPPNEGDNLLEFLSNLTFSGNSGWASDIAQMNGIPQGDFTSLMQTVSDATSQGTSFLSHDFFKTLVDSYAHNPLLGVATGLAAAGLSSPVAAAGGSSAAGAGGGFGGTIGGTTGATFDAAGNVLVTGAAPTLGGLGAGLGAGLGSAALPAVANIPSGYSGAPTQPGPADITVTAPAGGAGLGAPALTGIGLGSAAGAAALLGGGGAAAAPEGPPEPGQGPPDPTRTIPEAGAGIGAGAAAGAAGGLGLPGWLTLAGLAGSALQGTPDQTSSNTNAPPAYLQPYLSQAAGAAQQLYGQGNYVAPIQQSAIDYGTNVLNGNYLNSNPYLDATFNRAAGAVTNQVQSNFGRSGRDARGADAAGLATDKYNDLANQIYGGNYQAERDRMQQIVPQASQLGSVTNPANSLDDYIARLRNLGGNYGTATQTTPTQNNWWSGLAGLGLALMPGG